MQIMNDKQERDNLNAEINFHHDDHLLPWGIMTPN